MWRINIKLVLNSGIVSELLARMLICIHAAALSWENLGKARPVVESLA